ncbi:HpaII family restriction endonuclease [Pseudanabaena biceps]|nr:HpaII family restriction endonuclease [Pseudanabaena biceps]
MKANKGEWSEVYVLFRLLAEQKLYAGDQNFQRIDREFYPILEIIKDDSLQPVDFYIDRLNNIILISKLGISHEIKINEFTDQANYLLDAIVNGSKTFSPSNTNLFLSSIGCQQLKSPSRTKKDIEISLDEQIQTGVNNYRVLSFSIKSWLGSPPTLLNSSQATNFVFNFTSQSVTRDLISSVNSEKRFYTKFQLLLQANCLPVFDHVSSNSFNNNLILSDGNIPQILAHLLIEYYSSQRISKIKDLIENLKIKNPLNFGNTYFYERKIKRFLSDIALGMIPDTDWSGYHSVNGGHIVVRKLGEIVAYFYIYNQQGFEDYLYLNTKLDTPSPSRHKFGNLYRDNNQNLQIKLNLQIRFV